MKRSGFQRKLPFDRAPKDDQPSGKVIPFQKAKKPKAPKPPKCQICREVFEKRSATHVVCGPECAEEDSKRKREKEERRKEKARREAARIEREHDQRRREAIQTIPELKAIAQRIFNEYIRTRDKNLPCICCGKFNKANYLRGGEWDAGHYRSVGSADHLRFDERNCHRQLKHCNRDKGGNHVNYRRGLIDREGLEVVEALEADNAVIKWTHELLRQIIVIYTAKLAALKKADSFAQ